MQFKKIILIFAVLGITALSLFYYIQKVANFITIEDINTAYTKAQNGDKKALRLLIKGLKNPDQDIQKIAYNNIVKIGKPSVKFLIQLLEEKNPNIQEYGAAALGSIKDKETVSILIEKLFSDNFQRKYVLCWALGEINDPAAVEPLIKLYANEKEDTQKYIIRAIVKIGKPSVPALLKNLESEDENLQKLSIMTVGQIGGPNLVQPILKIANSKNMGFVILCLGDLADPKGINFLIKSLKNTDWQIRQKAAQSLTRFTDKKIIPSLKIALNDENTSVREWAAKAIECISGEKCLYKNEKGKLIYPNSLYH